MLIDNTNVHVTLTTTGENTIACKSLKEVFFNVFEIALNENIEFLKPLHRLLRDVPVVTADVTLGDSVFKNIEFKVVESNTCGIFLNQHTLANNGCIIEDVVIEGATTQEIAELIDEDVADVVEEYAFDAAATRQQVVEQKERQIQKYLQHLDEKLISKINDEIGAAKQSILTETFAVQNSIEQRAASEISKTIIDFKQKLKKWSENVEQHLIEYAEEAIADAEMQITEKSAALLDENKAETMQQLQLQMAQSIIDGLANAKEKIFNELQINLQQTITESTERLQTLINQHQQLQQNIHEAVVAQDVKINNFSNQINQITTDASTDVLACIKNADALIDNKIQAAVQQLGEQAQQLHNERMQSIEFNVAEILKDNLSKDDPQVVSEARASVRNAVKDALASYKTDMSKDLNAQLMNIQKELHNKLQLYTQSYAGGGSVAMQFADGGTMNGTLNVATGQILSAGKDLASIFSGGGGGSGGNQTLSFNESTAALTISNGNTVSLSALSGGNAIATGNYLPLTGGIVAGDLTVTRTLSATTLYATSAFVTIVDITQYELSGFNVTGNVTVNGTLSSSQVLYANAGNSNQWNSSYSTVNANSANWNYHGADIKALTGNWQNTYSTVNANSANWLQTLSFNSSNGNLTISNGNTAPISAFSVLSATNLLTNLIDFTPLTAAPTYVDGRLYYDSTEHTIAFMDGGSSLTFPINKLLWTIGINKTGSIIPKGTVVYLSGAQGNRGKMWPAMATTDLRSADTIGITMQSTAINQEGYIMAIGELEGIDTRAFAEGTTLYLSPTAAGGITDVKPQAPNHIVKVGFSLNSTVNGKIYVEIDNGYELNELHNVAINGATNGQGLIYNSASALWVNSDLYNGSDLKALSANWQNTYTNFSTQSANNISTYSTVQANSAQWAIDSTTDTGVRALTANWQNTYSTVQSNSAVWNQTAYLPLSGGTLTGAISTNQDIEITDSTKGIILKSPSNFKYRVTVNDAGELVTTLV